MKTQLTLTPDPIDELALIAEREMSDGMGAALVFHGVVRAKEDEATITAIDYEAFDDMACHQFELIFEEIDRQWPIESVRVVHRWAWCRSMNPRFGWRSSHPTARRVSRPVSF